jgi:hypothetical protein
MFRSAYGWGGRGYPRGYLGAGIGYPYMPLVLPFYGGYGYGYPGYGYYGGYGYPYPLYG